MEQIDRASPDLPSADISPGWLSRTATWALPLLLGACPATALLVASLVPLTGSFAWATEVLALGATPCLVAVLDVSAADWRSGRGPERRLLWLVGCLLALALAVAGVISAINLSMFVMANNYGAGAGELVWLLLLAATTVICSAYITRPDERGRAGRGALQGMLAWIGFCLPIFVALTIDLIAPPIPSPFAFLGLYLACFLVSGMVVTALLLAPLAGILGGTLRRGWKQE
jgi:hypothetical protein